MRSLKQFHKSFITAFSGFSELFVASLIVNVINLSTLPVVLLLMSPAEYGLISQIAAYISIITPLSILSSQLGIVKERDETVILLILAVSLFIIFIVMFGLFVIFFFDLVPLIKANYFLILYVLPIGIILLVEQILIRQCAYLTTAILMVIQAILLLIGKIAVPILNLAENYFAISIGVSLILSLIVHMLCIKNYVKLENFNINLKKLKLTMKQLRGYWCFMSPQLMFSALAQNIPIIYISYSQNLNLLGIFTLHRALASLPNVALAKAISDPVYRKLRDLKNVLQIKKVFKAYMLLSAVFSILVYVVIYIVAEHAISSLQSDWKFVPAYMILLIAVYFPSTVIRPLMAPIPLVRGEKALLNFEAMSLITKITFTMICLWTDATFNIFLVGFSVVSALFYILIGCYFYQRYLTQMRKGYWL
jgi:O-antigen/teichoic acid export membrane protein